MENSLKSRIAECQEKFIETTTLEQKCQVFKGIQWFEECLDSLKKELVKLKRLIATYVVLQAVSEEKEFPETCCWNGELRKFFVVYEDVPTIEKEYKNQLTNDLKKHLPGHLQEAFELKFGYRKLQQMVKKLDEQSQTIEGFSVDTKADLRSRSR